MFQLKSASRAKATVSRQTGKTRGRILTAIAILASSISIYNPSPAHALKPSCGKASWYGYESGSITANGERFNPEGLSAAHWDFPFGTKLRVTNQNNGKSVVIRVNDRGPAHWTGAIIDLSKGAFAQIAPLGQGRTTVCVSKVS